MSSSSARCIFELALLSLSIFSLVVKSHRKWERKKMAKKDEGPPGFEPGTYRTAADCSTTEL